MKIFNLILIIYIISTNSCKQESKKKAASVKTKIKSTNRIEVDKRTKLLITYYDHYTPRDNNFFNYVPFSNDVIYSASNASELNYFDAMLNESERTGYCCCPERHYTIYFYDKMNNYENYYVDTLDYSKKIRIYQSSFQFSYLVDKRTWSKFLRKISKVEFNEYCIYDLKLAKKVYAFAKENDLAVVTSNTTSKEWMFYDGEFKVRVSAVGEYLVEENIYADIKKAYPNDNFKITTLARNQRCGSNKINDCYEEYILQIFCNKDFYDKFNLYSPKSFYDKALATFYVIGEREVLDKIDIIAKKKE